MIGGRHISFPIVMRTRKKAHRQAHVPAGPLRNNHKAALKEIWDERPCLPSVTSRKAWARARGIDPTFVNKWFYARAQRARDSGFDLDAGNEGYDLDVQSGSAVEDITPAQNHLQSNTPEALQGLIHYEYSTASETGLKILLSPGRSSSPIFGSSFYSPRLVLDSPTGAYGHLAGVEQFIFTPPTPPRRKSTSIPCSLSERSVEDLQVYIRQGVAPLPVSPKPNNRLPTLPPAPKKPRQSRGSHDVLDFRVQDDLCLQLSPHALSPTLTRLGYSAPCDLGSRVGEEDDKPNVSTSVDLRMIVAKTSRLSAQKQGGCIGDNQDLNHTDNHTTTSFHKFLCTISTTSPITLKVSPLQLSVSCTSIKTSTDRTAHLPSQAKRRWLHRVHLRSTHQP